MAYAEHIPSQDPNPTQEQKDREAGEWARRLNSGEETVAQIADRTGYCRQTIYNRVKLINGQDLPDRDFVRTLHYNRLEQLYAGVNARLNGDISNADYFRGVSEGRAVLQRQSALLKVEGELPTPEPDADDDHDEEWVNVRAETEARLDEIRNGDG